MRSKKNIHDFNRRVIIKCLVAGVVIVITIAGLNLLTGGSAEAFTGKDTGSCGKNTVCQSLEGKEFDLIMYSFQESELVVLYDKSRVGEITPFARESNYRSEKGTINDALAFLGGHIDFEGFRIRKGRKSTGWFRTEEMEGVYVVEPRYNMSSSNEKPRYNFTEKEGEIRLYITPIYDMERE
jgi:hypothetical protein